MFEIGTSLRQAREQRGLQLAEVETRTHIRSRYLQALEDERFDLLPGDAYVKGFLRTYADALGLDANLYLAEYAERHPLEEELPLAPRPVARVRRPRRFPFAAVSVAAFVALALASVLATTVGNRGTQEPAAAPAPKTPAPAAAKPKAAAAHRPHRAAHRPRPSSLVLTAARGTCWLAVRVGSATGPVVYQSFLAQGRTIRFGVKRPLWIRLGAPWNVDARVGGRKLALPNSVANVLVKL